MAHVAKVRLGDHRGILACSSFRAIHAIAWFLLRQKLLLLLLYVASAGRKVSGSVVAGYGCLPVLASATRPHDVILDTRTIIAVKVKPFDRPHMSGYFMLAVIMFGSCA